MEDHLLATSSNAQSRARLLAVSAPDSGAWLIVNAYHYPLLASVSQMQLYISGGNRLEFENRLSPALNRLINQLITESN